MEFSKEAIRHALEWNGSSSIDGDGSDYCYDVLEQANPKLVATIKAEIAAEESLRPAPLVDIDAALERAWHAKKIKPTPEEDKAAYRKYLRSMPFHFIQD